MVKFYHLLSEVPHLLPYNQHQKEFIKDFRTVYGAVNKDSAAANLDLLESKI